MIFCVEDDAGIRELMVYTLNASGFEAVGFPDGAAIGTALGNNTGLGISLGMLIGLAIGSAIEKKAQDDGDNER